MFRPLRAALALFCLTPALAAAALSTLALVHGPLGDGRAGEITPPVVVGRDPTVQPTPPLPAGHVTIIIHGVNDDGREWSPRIKKALTESFNGPSSQEVYLFRWT